MQERQLSACAEKGTGVCDHEVATDRVAHPPISLTVLGSVPSRSLHSVV
jgi:hypothetical protein